MDRPYFPSGRFSDLLGSESYVNAKWNVAMIPVLVGVGIILLNFNSPSGVFTFAESHSPDDSWSVIARKQVQSSCVVAWLDVFDADGKQTGTYDLGQFADWQEPDILYSTLECSNDALRCGKIYSQHWIKKETLLSARDKKYGSPGPIPQ